ncbi:hypothetical protein [cf. Phormidesmis sp. LEGE 11477]|uniref:hypothetical protein n=1 Tax=cf. Phormidesmis sp. LEGE 11477 TaxID=1828680 RepID=UPI001882D1DB|nr:hypothetical protein [cf. Phormidesmis sp. LEGE 11477]MBE9061355.1 hypothetical protein [cf. Phormidesmis sp. LEGE 11477]
MDDDKNHAWRSYEKCKRVYQRLALGSLPNLTTATVVAALHFGANSSNQKFFYSDKAKFRSFEILQLVSDRLKLEGLEVSYKSTDNIDEDICFMAGSRYYVKSFSGLSNLVSECLSYGSCVWTPDNEFQKKTRVNSIRGKISKIEKSIVNANT